MTTSKAEEKSFQQIWNWHFVWYSSAFPKSLKARRRKSSSSLCHLSWRRPPHCSGCGCECEQCHACHICEIEFLTLRFPSPSRSFLSTFHPASNLFLYPLNRLAVESHIRFPIPTTHSLLCQAWVLLLNHNKPRASRRNKQTIHRFALE